MNYPDFMLQRALMEMRIEEARRINSRSLRIYQPQKLHWLARQSRRLLSQVGRRLVIVGQSLERFDLAQPSL
jgi:hypothetical protein